ncbi:hypothetical protein FACS1894101_1350 [Betaproteobacteria bacterium]|nr:hypothetical protein FACS1894101_1350 [Betaproteobacteria bacterium]
MLREAPGSAGVPVGGFINPAIEYTVWRTMAFGKAESKSAPCVYDGGDADAPRLLLWTTVKTAIFCVFCYLSATIQRIGM